MASRYNEYIGRSIPLSLSRAMKTYNVSPSDLSDLEEVYGHDDAAIVKAIKSYTFQGSFSVFEFWNRRPICGHCDGPHKHNDCPAVAKLRH